MTLACLAVAIAGAAAQVSSPQPMACVQAATWRSVATESDRQRLRDARTVWTRALAEAGAEAGPAAATDPLFDPDRALDRPLPPPGSYRCRLIGVGGVAKVLTRGWGRCEIGADTLVRLDGPQRPTGRLYTDSEYRAVFLGTMLIGDESRPVRYGRDRLRDMVGVVERVDTQRWRVSLPRQSFGATLDLLELVPA